MRHNVHNSDENRKDCEELTEAPFHRGNGNPRACEEVRNGASSDEEAINEGIPLGDFLLEDGNPPQTHEEHREEEEVADLRKNRDGEISPQKFEEDNDDGTQGNAEECDETRTTIGAFPESEEEQRQEEEGERIVELHRMDRHRVADGHGFDDDTEDAIRRFAVGNIPQEPSQPVKGEAKRHCGEERIQPLEERASLFEREEEERNAHPDAPPEETETAIPENKEASGILQIHTIQHEHGKDPAADEERKEVDPGLPDEMRELQSLAHCKSQEEFARKVDPKEEEQEVRAEEEGADLKGFKHRI